MGIWKKGLPIISGLWWKEICVPLELIFTVCQKVWRTLIKETFFWLMNKLTLSYGHLPLLVGYTVYYIVHAVCYKKKTQTGIAMNWPYTSVSCVSLSVFFVPWIWIVISPSPVFRIQSVFYLDWPAVCLLTFFPLPKLVIFKIMLWVPLNISHASSLGWLYFSLPYSCDHLMV